MNQNLTAIIEAALLVAGEPLSIDRLRQLFPSDEQPAVQELQQALQTLAEDYRNRGDNCCMHLVEVASGYTLQVKSAFVPWITKLWEERPVKYSRALLETLALIAYRQPITRGEIEEVRGVAVSTHIVKTLQDREWVRVVGHRDVPGKPALYATTRQFLDYFNLKNLSELPTLVEFRDLDQINPQVSIPLEVNAEEQV